MPRGLNCTHRELSLTGAVASDIWRPPALQAREDPNTNGVNGTVHLPNNSPWPGSETAKRSKRDPATQTTR